MMILGGSRRRERGVDSFSSNLSRETGFTETRRWRKLILMNVLRNRVALRRAEFSKSFGGRQRIFRFFLSTLGSAVCSKVRVERISSDHT